MPTMKDFDIDPDIRCARALPPAAYGDPELYARQRERVFVPSWQWSSELKTLTRDGEVAPFVHLPGCLDEPLVATRAGDVARVLSNVCTHRGHPVATCAARVNSLRCRYHGRRFDHGGRLLSMPEFEGAVGFPSADDHLAEVSVASWGPLDFVSLQPAVSLGDLFAQFDARVGALHPERLARFAEADRDYDVAANWMLYCDNYLEGLHIPFVHPGLDEVVRYDNYRVELAPWGVLQVAFGRNDRDVVFDLPPGHPDAGARVAAYYAWVFPNTMLNFYPWGLSLNVVQPVGPERTRVLFRAWAWDLSLREGSAGEALDEVEREDEVVVEATQRGVRARLAKRGRYSPTRETGVHHFHRMLAAACRG
jgi:choline monooxygenase